VGKLEGGALHHELSATDQRSADRRHRNIRQIEQCIAEANAEGVEGIAVKITLALRSDDHDDISSVQLRAAHADLVRLTGRDVLAEINSIVERQAAG
jgi:hypothetical protein